MTEAVAFYIWTVVDIFIIFLIIAAIVDGIVVFKLIVEDKELKR